MNILPLIILLVVAVPDSNGILQDNQTNYSNGIIVNQSLSNDIQDNYNNGIIITKKSELFDSDLIVLSTPVSTPISTATIISTPMVTSIPKSSGGSSGGSSSTGSGGGGITSSEDFKNIIQFETHENTLLVNQPVSYKFKLPIYEVLITGKENEYDVSVRVEILKNKSQKVIINPEGKVLTYFNVISNTKKIKEVQIKFKTNQSAKLMKWNGSMWINLVNNPINEVCQETLVYYYGTDHNKVSCSIQTIPNREVIGFKEYYKDDLNNIYYNYQIKTDSLSNFAIVKQSQQNSIDKPSETIVKEEPKINNNKIIATPKESPGFEIMSIIGVLLILLYKRKK